MTNEPRLTNRVKEFRQSRGLSQDDLASRSGLSRTGISAIEMGRLAPSTAAALSLARVFSCSVEELFALALPASEPQWAWQPRLGDNRYWRVEISGREVLLPVENTACGELVHDGVVQGQEIVDHEDVAPRQTLVLATCDPAVGLLATELAAKHGIRLIALVRSSGAALELLSRGLVHAAGIHFATDTSESANIRAARAKIPAARLLRTARWEEGVVARRASGSARNVLRSARRLVGREAGSAAQECLDGLLDHKRKPGLVARDHRGVAQAVSGGWADAGVCLRLAGAEAGLEFISVRRESYDLCFSGPPERDPRLTALVRAVRSARYRKNISEVPGYSAADSAELETIS